MSRKNLQAGEVLFHEHEPGECAYLIERGGIQVIVGGPQNPLVLAELGPGDLVGEMAMIDDAPRTATAVAIGETTLLVIDRENLAERVASTDPIVRALLGGQLKRYRAMLARMRGVDSPLEPTSREERLAIGKIRLESQLRDAVQGHRLEMHLQPFLEIATNGIAGYEALIRWNHPERGPVSPLEFITLAEETSLIVPIGQYMLHEALAALASFRFEGLDPLPFVSINVAARQLREAGLIESLLGQLHRIDLPTSAVKLEVTESQMLDYSQAAEVLSACRDAGIRVALDDFGTGFSNLSHLRELAFDTVKIDQSFLRNVEESRSAVAMLESIVGMVHAIGADALVEGVETAGQLEILRNLGVRYAQGYLIGKPVSLPETLTRHHARGMTAGGG